MPDKKYIITKYKGKILSCLMNGGRLHMANAYTEQGSRIGNIYIAKVKNIVKNLNAAFVEIADGELCYMSLDECKKPCITNRTYDGRILQQDELVVQLVKEAVKTKEAVVTTNISFTGKYAVVTAENSKIGYSGKLTNKVKNEIKAYLSENLDHNAYGIIIRTNAEELHDYAMLLQEIEVLTKKCDRIFQIAKTRTCFSVLERVLPGYLLQMRDLYATQYDVIVTDIPAVYEEAKLYLEQNQPEDLPKLTFYEDKQFPLSKLYALETKMKTATDKHVWLKSGGYLIFEPTEALTVIDVNSGKCMVKKSKEDTAYMINIEAAEEIAIQLRLRNISGIIIVDFINQRKEEHKKQLLKHLTALLNKDAVLTTVIDMTPLGLVEITRKKVNKTLAEQLKE